MSVQVSYYDNELYSIYLCGKDAVMLFKYLKHIRGIEKSELKILLSEEFMLAEDVLNKILDVNHE